MTEPGFDLWSRSPGPWLLWPIQSSMSKAESSLMWRENHGKINQCPSLSDSKMKTLAPFLFFKGGGRTNENLEQKYHEMNNNEAAEEDSDWRCKWKWGCSWWWWSWWQSGQGAGDDKLDEDDSRDADGGFAATFLVRGMNGGSSSLSPTPLNYAQVSERWSQRESLAHFQEWSQIL